MEEADEMTNIARVNPTRSMYEIKGNIENYTYTYDKAIQMLVKCILTNSMPKI